MNKVDSKRKDCAPTGGCEPPSNGSECELQQSVCDNIEKINLKTKALNGVVNGTDVDVVHEEHPPMAKTGKHHFLINLHDFKVFLWLNFKTHHKQILQK